jgi:hypothetical protein
VIFSRGLTFVNFRECRKKSGCFQSAYWERRKNDAPAVKRRMNTCKRILDPCCGSRMMWFDRGHAETLFGDRRRETLTVTDRSHGRTDGTRTLHINPDMILDFRRLPFPDCTFRLVAFDPPHLVRAGAKSWMAAKYGKLGPNWRDDLRSGFVECFRVLEIEDVLVFKWNETQVKLCEILGLAPHQPLFGSTGGKKAGTHWMIFMKPGAAAPA